MSRATTARNTRVLIIDDNEEIHEDFRQILAGKSKSAPGLDELESRLFGGEAKGDRELTFELSSAFQGQEGLERVREAVKNGAPYAVVFVDVRMPPGWDGIETLGRILEEDPAIQAVVCSAYSDYSWERVVARLGLTDRLLILRKPFDSNEVLQMACALTEKWSQQQALRENQSRMAALLEAIPDTILRLDREGRCLDYKPAGELAPALPDDVIGRSVHELLPGDASRHLLACTARALDGEGTQTFEFQQGGAEETREFEARISRGGAGEVVMILRDTTRSKKAEAERRAREETIRTQRATLDVLSTPIIPISRHIVVVPLIGEVDRRRAHQMRDTLCRGVTELKPRVAILDLTGVSGVTTETAEELLRVAAAVELLGTQLVITGIRPEVAMLLVELGVDLSRVTTHATLQSGIAHAMKRR